MANMKANSSCISRKSSAKLVLLPLRFPVASRHSDLLQSLLTFVAFPHDYIVHCKNNRRILVFFLSVEWASLNYFIAMFDFQVFPANKDRNTVAEHLLVTVFNARLIRFHPKTYHGYTSMRVEVYGCRNGMYMLDSNINVLVEFY